MIENIRRKPRLIAVVGQQRTGSTVLRQMIASNAAHVDLGEIFHDDTSYASNFWGYLINQIRVVPGSVCPSKWHDLWPKYIDEQKRRSRSEVVVFDLKIEVFNDVILTIPSGSWFFFPADQMQFVFLERKNVMAQAISLLKARHWNDWGWLNPQATPSCIAKHDFRFEKRSIGPRSGSNDQDGLVSPEEGGKLQSRDISISPFDLEAEMTRISELNIWGKRILSQYGFLHLYYEDLFDENGSFRASTVSEIADICGVEEYERVLA